MIKMYLIHGIDKSREQRMIEEFNKSGIELSSVEWIRHPNKNEISDSLLQEIVIQYPSITCGISTSPNNMTRGVASCSYKHYLALKNIVENNYEYAVIMEDNMQFFENINIPDRLQLYINQLNSLYPNWDILFDLNYGKNEYPLVDGVFVYPKSNEINEYGHGGTRCAQFYLLTYKCAKKLYENYLPFNNAPDWWMNDLFRKLNINSFWAYPPAVNIWIHTSTAN